VPLQTKLLKDAAARGLKTVDGLGMLMHQAAPSFEAFFGKRPEVGAGLRASLERELRARG
jgi:shikimate dehydrogenase